MSTRISRLVVLVPALLLGVTVRPSTTSGGSPGSPVLERLMSRALEANPDLRAQRERIRAAELVPSQAKALPDPTVDLELMNLSIDHPNLGDALTEGLSLGVSQMIPNAAKRRAAERSALAEVEVERARLRAMEQEVRAEVEGAAYRFRTSVDLLGVNSAMEDALRSAVEGALAKYATGGGTQVDVLQAQTALGQLGVERAELERLREVALGRLRALVAGPVQPSELSEVELPEPLPLPPLETLLDEVEESSPGVAAAGAEAASAGAGLEAAKASGKPDFMVGARYRRRDMSMDGGDYLTAMVGITLPFFHRSDRYRPAEEQALHRQRAALEGVAGAVAEARYALVEAYASAARNLKAYGLYRDGLLLQARQAYEAGLASYASGTSDFGALLRALTDAYAYQAEAASARGAYLASVAAAEAVLGRRLQADEAGPQVPRPLSESDRKNENHPTVPVPEVGPGQPQP